MLHSTFPTPQFIPDYEKELHGPQKENKENDKSRERESVCVCMVYSGEAGGEMYARLLADIVHQLATVEARPMVGIVAIWLGCAVAGLRLLAGIWAVRGDFNSNALEMLRHGLRGQTPVAVHFG